MKFENLNTIVSSVRNSTAAVDFPELPNFVELHLVAAHGRREGAIERTRQRSLAIRQGIGNALGALPLERELSELAYIVRRRLQARPRDYGVNSAPSLVTIRDEIYKLQIDSGFRIETYKQTCLNAPST